MSPPIGIAQRSGGTMPIDSETRILRLKSVLYRTGLSRSTLYRKIERGTFPAQVRISERCIGWRESDIEQWLKNPVSYSRLESERSASGLD
jgi:prophage regulatory protein